MRKQQGSTGKKPDVNVGKPAYDTVSKKRKRCASSETFVRSDDVLRWRRDGAEGVVSYNADAAYIYCRSDGSGVSFVLLLLNSSLLLII